MTELTISLVESDYLRLENVAKLEGKSIQEVIQDWVDKMLDIAEPFDVTQDPIFLIEGYESDSPSDLSINVDKYIYGEKHL
jgi:hypothetical protein